MYGRKGDEARMGDPRGIMNKKKKKAYAKPRIVYRDKIEVLAAVCDSSWTPDVTCMLVGNPACIKTRFG